MSEAPDALSLKLADAKEDARLASKFSAQARRKVKLLDYVGETLANRGNSPLLCDEIRAILIGFVELM